MLMSRTEDFFGIEIRPRNGRRAYLVVDGRAGPALWYWKREAVAHMREKYSEAEWARVVRVRVRMVWKG
jgi:hypothetical protein